MENINTKKKVAEEIFGMSFQTLVNWAGTKNKEGSGVPAGKLVNVDKRLTALEKARQNHSGGTQHDRQEALLRPENLNKRLRKCWPGLF